MACNICTNINETVARSGFLQWYPFGKVTREEAVYHLILREHVKYFLFSSIAIISIKHSCTCVSTLLKDSFVLLDQFTRKVHQLDRWYFCIYSTNIHTSDTFSLLLCSNQLIQIFWFGKKPRLHFLTRSGGDFYKVRYLGKSHIAKVWRI